MEGDGNAGLVLFQRRVLSEILDQTIFSQLSNLFNAVRM
jgi:hypothetical protein